MHRFFIIIVSFSSPKTRINNNEYFSKQKQQFKYKIKEKKNLGHEW